MVATVQLLLLHGADLALLGAHVALEHGDVLLDAVDVEACHPLVLASLLARVGPRRNPLTIRLEVVPSVWVGGCVWM